MSWTMSPLGVLVNGVPIGTRTACMNLHAGGAHPNTNLIKYFAGAGCDGGTTRETWRKVQVPDCLGFDMTYSTSAGFECATPCDPGFAPNATTRVCEACPPNTYSEMFDCLQCVEGTFSGPASSNCTNCAVDGSGCEACPVGKALDFDLGCVECAAGTFNDVPGGEVCPKCAPGSAQSSPGSESCLTCLPGFVQPEEGKTNCVSCAAGESNNANRTICEACAPGTFAESSGSACELCPAGQYQDGTGATSCKPCGKGEYSAEGQDKCALCPAGTFNDKGGSGECSKCPTNTVQKEEGQTECTECKRGEAPNEAATECAPCPPGTHAKDGVCVECAAGSFSQGGASSCDLCDEGFSSEAGSTECKPCEEGVTKTRGAVCELCPEGQKPNPERRRCALCGVDDPDPACKLGESSAPLTTRASALVATVTVAATAMLA